MRDPSKRLPGEAVLKYGDASYQILHPGQFVVCAVTGQRIPLRDLKYWSVDLQEPYVDAAAAMKRMRPDAK